MERKRITSLDSLMIFSGVGANNNAYALQERQYDIFSDEYIGTLQLNEDYDSVFSYTLSEVFIETAPKYKSIKDLTEVAYTYICNRSQDKPTKTTSMYIDEAGTINFKYDFERGLAGKIENTKNIPISDIHLYFSSINNGMFNKQKYYSYHKEIESLSNYGIKYFWRPQGSYFKGYDPETKQDYTTYNGNDFISYLSYTIQVQETRWDEDSNTYVGVFIEQNQGTEDNPDIQQVPKMVSKTVFEYMDSFDNIIRNKLNQLTESFKTKHDESLLSYYLYELNSTIPVVANTFTFGQNTINVNLNYDGEFNNWFNNVIKFSVKDVTSKDLVSITPAQNYYFNLAINKDNRFIGSDKRISNETMFSLKNLDELTFEGISILSPYKIRKLDFSPIADSMVGKLDLVCNYNKKINSKDTVKTNWVLEKGNQIEEIIIGREGIDCQLESITGLEYFKDIKKLSLINCNNLSNNPDINTLPNVSEFDLTGSNVTVFNPASGSYIELAKLPDAIESIILNDIEFEAEDSLIYNISDKLTTLELNYVKNLDTYEFVSKWIDTLVESGKLDTGLVNYVNINGVYWYAAAYELLRNLSIIELNYFSGTINVDGVGAGREIYRKQYRDLVSRYGQQYVLLNGKEAPEDSDLFINVTTGNNAFNIKFAVTELYDERHWETDEYGDSHEIVETKERDYKEYTINVVDTLSGNSLLDMVQDDTEKVKEAKEDDAKTYVSQFAKKQFVGFKNGNNVTIGWQLQLPKPIYLPQKSENPEQLYAGDVLLFNKQTLVFITKNCKNINQNFTKIGKFEDVDEFNKLVNHKFDKEAFFYMSYMEDEIEIPQVDEYDNYIEVEYGPGSGYIEVEYGLGNYIEVEYGQ